MEAQSRRCQLLAWRGFLGFEFKEVFGNARLCRIGDRTDVPSLINILSSFVTRQRLKQLTHTWMEWKVDMRHNSLASLRCVITAGNRVLLLVTGEPFAFPFSFYGTSVKCYSPMHSNLTDYIVLLMYLIQCLSSHWNSKVYTTNWLSLSITDSRSIVFTLPPSKVGNIQLIPTKSYISNACELGNVIKALLL